MLPTLCNEFISLLKETSVAGYIAIPGSDQGRCDIIRSRTYSAFMPLIAVALIYLIIVMIFTKLIQILERRLRQNESANMNKEPLIRVQDLGKSFGSIHVLKGINVNIYKGDVVSWWGLLAQARVPSCAA